jgi:serine/threonine protein kinase/tetratricopeptide (TPR) repeat protein
MPDTTPPRPVADRNLLFGILALQMDFIRRDALIAAMNAWVLDKGKPIGEILQELGQLTADRRRLLDSLVVEHLKAHDNDAERSLAAVPARTLVHADLGQIPDADLQKSLQGVPPPDTDATGPYLAGRTVADGAGVRYHILRPHARGGLGEVFVALDQELHREVALKEMQERYAGDAHSCNRFVVEAEVTGRLEHPGIVPVYGLGRYSDGRPYYAMRFIRGESLKEAIDRFHKANPSNSGEHSLALRQLLGRFVAVCNAVAYAHSRGVLHRDLKPSNILLGQYGETLLVDWGLARTGLGQAGATETEAASVQREAPLRIDLETAPEATLQGQVLGTPAYMSPEQAAGRLDLLGPASDVYSLGATLYTLLVGRPPFEEQQTADILKRVQHGDVASPREVRPDVPRALAAICLKAMALEPAQRYATALELAAEIEHWLADEPVRAWPEPWTRRARRWVGRHRALASGAAAAGLVALASLAVATVLLTAANSRERAALALAEQQKGKAEDNFRLARQAVDEYITKVSEDPRLKEHDLEALRKNLLESALSFYQRFVETHGTQTELQAEHARALVRLADITESLSSRADAIRLYEEALAIRERLVADSGGDAEYRRELAAMLRNLASMYRKTGREEDADRTLNRSVNMAEALVAEDPTRDDNQRVLAGSLLTLAEFERENKEWQRAEELLRRANTILTPLAERKAAPAGDLLFLGLAQHNLGEYLKASGKPDAAIDAFRQTLKWLDACPPSTDFPEDTRQAIRGLAVFNIAELDRHAGHANEAEAGFIKARDLLRTVARKHPSVTDYQTVFAAASTALGVNYQETGRLDLAEDSLREGRLVWQALTHDDPSTPSHWKNLAATDMILTQVYIQLGRPQQVDRYVHELIDVIEAWLRLQPGLFEARRQLAGARLLLADHQAATGRPKDAEAVMRQDSPNWEALLRERPDDAEVERNSAVHSLHWAHVLAGDRPNDALPRFQRALELRHGWLKRHPTDQEARADLAQILGERAQVFGRLNRVNDAIADQQEAIAEQKRLIKESTDPLHWRDSLAGSLDTLANLHKQGRQLAQAEAAFLRALEIREALVREQPGTPSYQTALAELHNHLGILYYDLNNSTKSEAHYRQAIAVGTKNAKESWQHAQLGGYHCNLAHSLRRRESYEPALLEYTEAARNLEELWTDPNLAPNIHRTVRTYLGNSYSGRLAVFLQLNRQAEALADDERLLQIDPERYAAEAPFVRALMLARLGVAGRAIAEADRLAARPKLTAGQLYNVAGTYARAARPERALELLGKARAAGYFADAAAAERLRQDADFESLKGRADFQKFLADVAR